MNASQPVSLPLIPTMRSKMMAGRPFVIDSGIRRMVTASASRVHAFTACDPADTERRAQLLAAVFAEVGEGVEVRGALHVELGERTTVGARTVLGAGFSCVDYAPVAVGADVVIGANVSISTLLLPHDPDKRAEKWAGGAAVSIGDNVWIGAGVVINPGVTVGANAVVESGSVVVNDVEPDTLVAGNPAKLIRRR
ncbi:DapH/DapD/GlmU-related protein [Nocardioides yefusunii]|uniref:DapH/DapD/GlmU-related protein n=1 Tax=Nocardioides yefusunii TaxID=2500546 RepID=A0ABW1QYW9_9ACTN|nr:DapH/DapD/GlmU-related protein [Nocardioides yefusunii]